MSKASALAAAQGTTPTPAPAATPPATGTLVVTPRQASRTPVPKDQATPGAVPTAAAPAPAPEAPAAPAAPDERTQILIRKEAALQKQREELKAQEAGMAAERAKFEEVGKRFKDFEEMKSKDPIAAMKLAGFSDTDIFNYYAKAQEEAKLKDTPEAKAKALAQEEINKFKQELTVKEQQLQQERDAQVIRQFKGKISQTVTADKEKFEFCNYYGAEAEALIFATVEETLRETKEVITPAQAAEMVEAFYESRAKDVQKLKKLTPAQAAAQEPPAPQPIESKPQSRTLSNKVSATVASTAAPGAKPETREEKKARLVKQIQEHGLRK